MVGLFALVLLYFTFQIIEFVIYPLIWSAIIAFATWPAHQFLERHLRWQHNTIATLLTALAVGMLLLIAFMVVDTAKDEIPKLATMIKSLIHQPISPGLAVPSWLGDYLESWRQRYIEDPSAWQDVFRERGVDWFDNVLYSMLFVGSNGLGLIVILLGLFYFYRNGERWLTDLRRASLTAFGSRVSDYWLLLRSTTQAVVYDFCLTAIIQGSLAGLGYWVSGLNIPILLGALTTLLAFFPFGTPLVWGCSGLFLIFSGETSSGIALLLWGALIVSTVDNFLRPWIIGRTAKIPFFWVLIGIVGGLQTFGLIGLFLGPILLNFLRITWQTYLHSLLAVSPANDEHSTLKDSIP